MNKPNRIHLSLTACGILACLSPTAGAQIFTDGFNAAAGNQNNTQGTTTFAVQFGATYDNWGITGSSGHQVDLNPDNAGQVSGNPENLPNANNWAAMLLLNQQLLSNANIAANDVGVGYKVDFVAGPADYSGGQGSANGNGLRIEVIDNDGAGAVIGTTDFTAVDFTSLASNLDLGLSSGSFNYTGTGNGNVKIRITGLGSGVFNGSIDEISVSPSGGPGITSFTATPSTLADSEDPVTFDWTVTNLPLDSLVITPGDIDVLGDTDGAGVGSYLLNPGPNGTTEYTLTATKGLDVVTANVTVTLPPPAIISFAASPMPVVSGGDLTLSWDVIEPFTTLTLDPGGIDVSGSTVGGVGSILVNPTATTTYTLTATRGTSTSNATAKGVVVSANAIFSEHFNGYAGTQNATQYQTGLEIAFGGTVTGWSNAGAGTMHAVDLANLGGESNPSDWAIMFFQDNVITQSSGIVANDSGASYEVTFEFGTAVYAGDNAGQIAQRTMTGDGLLVEVLRADDSVLASQSFLPGAWDDPSNHNLDAGLQGALAYVGDGTGDVRLRIGPDGSYDSGRFEGTIDNICVNLVSSGSISIDSFTATPSTLTDAGDAVTFDWTITGGPLDSLEITPGNIDVLGETSHLLDPGPNGTTEYTLTAVKGGEMVTRNVTVTLPAPVISSFTATPAAVLSGEPVTLSVQVDLPVTTLTVDPGAIPVSVDGSGAGSIVVNPTATTTYTLTATRGLSTSTADATAAVYDPANLFSEDFEGITGLGLNGGPDGQATTTHDLGAGGSLAGWSKSGAGTIHAVDTANTWTDSAVSTNTPNWGVMIWQDNIITQDAGVPASNDSGIDYRIDFLAAGAVYTNSGHVNNGTTDGLKVEVLRASDDAVLHTFAQVVAQPVGVGDLGLTPYSFNYTGDGSGDIKFRIGPVNAGQGRFQGTIDDLLLSVDAGGGNDFSDWIAGFNVGAQTGIDDDPDNDGVDSGVENFFGTAPDEFTQGLVMGAVDTGAGSFTFTHPQTGTLAEDLTATYQWSVDLANFFADGVEDGGVQVDFVATPNSPSPGTTTVVATVTGPVPVKLFVSVKVTQP